MKIVQGQQLRQKCDQITTQISVTGEAPLSQLHLLPLDSSLVPHCC